MKEKKKWNHNWLFSNLANKGRYAGHGSIEDDYSEDSGGKRVEIDEFRPLVRFVTDKQDPNSLNGPVIVVQEGRKKDDK